RHEEALLRAGEQPIDHTRVRRPGSARQPVLPTIEALDVELLARLDLVLAADLGRQDDLALGRYSGFHLRKVPSYIGSRQSGLERQGMPVIAPEHGTASPDAPQE